MKDIQLIFFAIVILISVTVFVAWGHAYLIGPALNKPRVYPHNCTAFFDCVGSGIIFPRINCSCSYYGTECETHAFGWCKKLD